MKMVFSIAILAIFFIAAVGSGSSSRTTSNSSSRGGYSSDAYSIPVRPGSGACSICGARGYIMVNGVKEICMPCNGTGKAVSFPEK